MFPDIDHQYLACSQSEERTLALKVLVFSSFTAIRAFDVYDQDVVSHLDCRLVLGHPYSLCSLLPLRLGHYTKVGIEKGIEQGGFSSRLRAEYGYEVVVEASMGNVGILEILG